MRHFGALYHTGGRLRRAPGDGGGGGSDGTFEEWMTLTGLHSLSPSLLPKIQVGGYGHLRARISPGWVGGGSQYLRARFPRGGRGGVIPTRIHPSRSPEVPSMTSCFR